MEELEAADLIDSFHTLKINLKAFGVSGSSATQFQKKMVQAKFLKLHLLYKAMASTEARFFATCVNIAVQNRSDAY